MYVGHIRLAQASEASQARSHQAQEELHLLIAREAAVSRGRRRGAVRRATLAVRVCLPQRRISVLLVCQFSQSVNLSLRSAAAAAHRHPSRKHTHFISPSNSFHPRRRDSSKTQHQNTCVAHQELDRFFVRGCFGGVPFFFLCEVGFHSAHASFLANQVGESYQRIILRVQD